MSFVLNYCIFLRLDRSFHLLNECLISKLVRSLTGQIADTTNDGLLFTSSMNPRTFSFR